MPINEQHGCLPNCGPDGPGRHLQDLRDIVRRVDEAIFIRPLAIELEDLDLVLLRDGLASSSFCHVLGPPALGG